MRDIVITLIILASLPCILKSPTLGALMWVWVSVMNPHTLGWGFAARLPFAFLIAITTVTAMLMSPVRKQLPLNGITWTLIAFVLWMNVTTPFALAGMDVLDQWAKVMKIMLMTFVVLLLIRDRHDVQRLIWVLVLSLGFYGVKGGIFTLKSGGEQKVWGPEGTFIGDNNAIALALIITIPLMFYLQQQSANKWLRRGLVAMMLLSALAALASYSRGALLGLAAMGLFMWYRSGKKIALGAALLLVAPLFLIFMPQGWSERMDSIGDYAVDASAQGRLNAWRMAWNLASDRFIGGGFDVAEPAIFARYAPNPLDVHAAHSIYFQVLGEHGFVGLGLYLLLGILSWRSANWIVRATADRPDLHWAAGLTRMIQASMLGFAVGGAFLSLLYFDVPYYLMVALVVTRVIVSKELGAGVPAPRKPS
jgi:probable O-glycosylation ligase (exosortase A-associated)